MKKIEFVRWGGLSSVNHKKIFRKDSFHAPPVKRGIYVFHPQWIELFLVAWKWYDNDGEKKKHIDKQRRFKYEGKIWTHVFHSHPEITYYRHKGEWYETDTSCIPKIFSLESKKMAKQINSDPNWGGKWYRHANKWVSKDHMELFIEKV